MAIAGYNRGRCHQSHIETKHQKMTRKKKIFTKLKAKDKRANAKLHKSNKPAYISKAEREKLEQQENTASQE